MSEIQQPVLGGVGLGWAGRELLAEVAHGCFVAGWAQPGSPALAMFPLRSAFTRFWHRCAQLPGVQEFLPLMGGTCSAALHTLMHVTPGPQLICPLLTQPETHMTRCECIEMMKALLSPGRTYPGLRAFEDTTQTLYGCRSIPTD